MAKSKCTCKSRNALAHVLNDLYPHEAGCHYAAVLKQKADERALRDEYKTLYSHYSRVAKKQ